MGSLQSAKSAIESFRAKTIAAGRRGLYLNVVDYKLPEDARSVFQSLGVDSITSYVWVHKIKLKDFPKTDYNWAANAYFSYWDAHKDEYGVPYFPNATSGRRQENSRAGADNLPGAYRFAWGSNRKTSRSSSARHSANDIRSNCAWTRSMRSTAKFLVASSPT
jgi:hypothetical protein